MNPPAREKPIKLVDLVKNSSVKCLQTTDSLKDLCELFGLEFTDYLLHKSAMKADIILSDKRIDNQTHYLVLWAGSKGQEIRRSWVPLAALNECDDLVHYYESLKKRPDEFDEDTLLFFVKDLVMRKPRDMLSLIRLCALIYGTDESYVWSLKLSFSELRKKTVQILDIPVKKLNKIGKQLYDLMKFAESRKVVLLSLKQWEMEINAKTTCHVGVENDVDLEGPPDNFHYINECFSHNVDLSGSPVVFCSCDSCGNNRNGCCPRNFDMGFPYDRYGRLQLMPGYLIYECNSACKCGCNCANRVVQHGPKKKLAIFKTSNGCGWGLKSLEEIQSGEFVIEYVGEIITTKQAEERGKVYDHLGYTYLFDLDHITPAFTADAFFYGNASRFVNHSCDPNMHVFAVWVNQMNPKISRLAFFAKRKICSGEELTFDYKMTDRGNPSSSLLCIDEGRILCKCDSKNCRKYLY